MSQRAGFRGDWGKASMRRHLVETASVSSESRIVSSEASSRRRPARGKRASGGEMQAEDLIIDIDADFSREEVHADLGARRRNLRSKFPPHQAGAEARTRAIDRGIRDTHLQNGLKDHPFTQARRGEVCCIFSWSFKFLLYACANK